MDILLLEKKRKGKLLKYKFVVHLIFFLKNMGEIIFGREKLIYYQVFYRNIRLNKLIVLFVG